MGYRLIESIAASFQTPRFFDSNFPELYILISFELDHNAKKFRKLMENHCDLSTFKLPYLFFSIANIQVLLFEILSCPHQP